MGIHRETFRHSLDYVAVRPVRLSADTVIEPGQEIDKDLVPRFLLRALYRRRRIGVKDSAWAKEMLADADNAAARPEVTKRKKAAKAAKAEPKDKPKAENKPISKGDEKAPKKKLAL